MSKVDTESRSLPLNGTQRSLLLWVVGFGLLAMLPFVLDYQLLGFSIGAFVSLKLLILTLIWAFTGQSWNIMSGFTGYFSFGHAAFFGIGAYTTQVLLVDHSINPWFGMIAGGLIAMGFGLLLGYLNFRYNLEGHYFALATFAFAMLAQAVAFNLEEINGALGFYRPLPAQYASGYGLVAFQFREDLPYYFLIFAFLVIVTIVAGVIKRSQIGLYMLAIREDEDAAMSIGIPTFRYKMIGIGISAFFTAWAGSYWSMFYNTINPDIVFQLLKNILIILPAIVGGLGTIAGPIIGSFLVTPLAELLRIHFDQVVGIDLVAYGIALILFGIYLPKGILSLPYFRD